MKNILFTILLLSVCLLSEYAHSQNVLNPTGNVGVGTSSPATLFHVNGGAAMSGGWNKTSTLQATYPVQIFNSAGMKFGGIGYDHSTGMRFWVNGTSDDLHATASTAISVLNNGNVGIGVGSPSTLMHLVAGASPELTIESNTNSNAYLTLKGGGSGAKPYKIYSTGQGSELGPGKLSITDNVTEVLTIQSGKVGIGTTTPAAKLSFGNVTYSSPDGITWFDPSPTSYGIHRTSGSWAAPDYQQLRLGWDTGIVLDPGSTTRKSYVDVKGGGLRVSSGSVGIGTTNTNGYTLAVAGTAIAESMTVRLQGAWPDYVFSPGHKLPTLAETEAFILKNKHLPGIPAAAEVAKEGINLGEMNAKFLQKIEELTLHLIQMDKKYQKQITNQQIRIDLLESGKNKP